MGFRLTCPNSEMTTRKGDADGETRTDIKKAQAIPDAADKIVQKSLDSIGVATKMRIEKLIVWASACQLGKIPGARHEANRRSKRCVSPGVRSTTLRKLLLSSNRRSCSYNPEGQ